MSLLAVGNLFCALNPGTELRPPDAAATATGGDQVVDDAPATSSPQPTDTPRPTDTPAPTDTSAPTETPAPTNTPAPTATSPPTSTPLPLVEVHTFTDGPDDATLCTPPDAPPDLQVDINVITVTIDGPPITEIGVQIDTFAPFVDPYSAAVVTYLYTLEGEPFAYKWEVHDDQYSIGSMDPNNFLLLGGLEGGLDIVRQDGSVTTIFSIPWTDELGRPAGVGVKTFYMREFGGMRFCDEAGGFRIPLT